MSEQLYSKGQKITSTSNKSNNIVHHNTTVETKLDELDGKIVEVTDAWSNTKSYSVNDYALYNDILYKCILAHSNIVPTNTTYWKPCTIGSEFSQLNNDLSGVRFGIDASGNYGYYKVGADTLTPFRKATYHEWKPRNNADSTTIVLADKPTMIILTTGYVDPLSDDNMWQAFYLSSGKAIRRFKYHTPTWSEEAVFELGFVTWNNNILTLRCLGDNYIYGQGSAWHLWVFYGNLVTEI